MGNKNQGGKTKFKLGHQLGKKTQFKKGNKAWNAGTKGLTGRNVTSFAKAIVPHNTTTVGSISKRTDKTGRVYQWIKVDNHKWEMLHRHIWEQVNGAVKPGFIVIFKDGDTMNCVLENLELVHRSSHAVKNRYKGTVADDILEVKMKLSHLNHIVKKSN